MPITNSSAPKTLRHDFDIIIFGGGIMGLGLAFELGMLGQKILLVDKGGPRQKASWAAAGILVTRDARRYFSPFREFYLRSIHKYPEWLQRIESKSEMVVPINAGGDFIVFDMDATEGVKAYTKRLDQLKREGAEKFTESNILPEIVGKERSGKNFRVMHFPEECHLGNRDVLKSLTIAVEKLGVQWNTWDPDSRLVQSGGGWKWVSNQGEFTSAKCAITAGVKSIDLLQSLGWELPMIPVKGQVAMVEALHSSNAMIHWNDGAYAIPKPEGTLIGATTEPGIWEEDWNDKGSDFLKTALTFFSPHQKIRVLDQWTGLRPRARDRLPVMGMVDSDAPLAICTGHYKCGISMAPLAAQSMAALITGSRPLTDLEPFDPHRKGCLRRVQNRIY